MDWIVFGAIVFRNASLPFKAELSEKGEVGLTLKKKKAGVYELTGVFTVATTLDYSEIQTTYQDVLTCCSSLCFSSFIYPFSNCGRIQA